MSDFNKLVYNHLKYNGNVSQANWNLTSIVENNEKIITELKQKNNILEERFDELEQKFNNLTLLFGKMNNKVDINKNEINEQISELKEDNKRR
jgi:hypothetical protein